MPFKPGQSGNPSGMRPKSLEQRQFEELARKKSPAALRFIAEVMNNPKAPMQARVNAAQIIIDRGYGRPTQPIEQDLNVYNYGIADRQPTPEEWLDKYTAMQGRTSHIAH